MINSRKIIGIVAIVFVVLVGYKFISSSIQENKEKAVLQERYRLGELSKQPLEICLKKAKDESIYNGELDNILSNSTAFDYGMIVLANEKCSIHSNKNDSYNCKLNYIFTSELTQEEKESRFRTMIDNVNAGNASYEKVKEDCYKQYK